MVNNLKHFDTFQDIVKRYKDLYGIDLSNLKYIEDNVARNNNGSIANIPSDEFGGSWLKNHSIIINPDPEPVIKHYGLSMQAKDFLRHIMAHEMAHDVSYNPKYKDLYKKMVEEAKDKKFTTPYMDVVPEDKYDNELFSEYMAHLINEKTPTVKKAELDPAVAKLVEEVKTINKYRAPEHTQTLKDILRSKGTNCWGISRLALNRLRKAGLDPETTFIYEDEGNMLPTHQFTTFRDGDKYRIHDYWFNDRGQISDLFDSREAAIDDRVKKWRAEENHPETVYAYTGTSLPPVGYTPEEYMGAIMMCNKLLKSYPALEKQSALLKIAKLLTK